MVSRVEKMENVGFVGRAMEKVILQVGGMAMLLHALFENLRLAGRTCSTEDDTLGRKTCPSCRSRGSYMTVECDRSDW